MEPFARFRLETERAEFDKVAHTNLAPAYFHISETRRRFSGTISALPSCNGDECDFGVILACRVVFFRLKLLIRFVRTERRQDEGGARSVVPDGFEQEHQNCASGLPHLL